MEENLREALEKLLNLKGECSFEVMSDLDLSNVSMTQLNYLKQVKRLDATTISELSEILELSKPTVTETIKKLEHSDLVCKRKCHADARKYYIELTEKGQQFANVEKITLDRLVEALKNRLSSQDIEKIIEALDGLKL